MDGCLARGIWHLAYRKLGHWVRRRGCDIAFLYGQGGNYGFWNLTGCGLYGC